MADDPGIDPRYAAQFQRGYDPARHGPAPASPPARDPAAPARLPGGPAATAERVPDRPSARMIPPPPEASPRTDASATETAARGEATDEADDAEAGGEERRASRIEWVLPGLGAVLLLAAAWIYLVALADRTMYTGGADDYVAMMMLNTLPGPLLVAAVLAFTVWLVVRALRRAG